MDAARRRERAAAALMAAAVLAGCASAPTAEEPPTVPDTQASLPPGTDPNTDDASDEEPASADAGVELVEVAITDGQVQTDRSRVDISVGTMVRIAVRSDVDDEVHVHGYDLFVPVSPGEPAELEFTADLPGAFEVEAEHSGIELFQLRVR